MKIPGFMYRVLRGVASRGVRPLSTDVLGVNTNTAKDVILFKYENPKYFKMMNLFAISQLGFWSYLAHFSYTELRNVKPPEGENLPWWKKINMGDPKFKRMFSGLCLLFGVGMFISSWTFTLRSVRFLILRKGGKVISLVTYTPFGHNRIMDVPLKYMSAAESRGNARVHLPLKVQGKLLYYMLDMRGEFLNKGLFDATAGMQRKFNF